MINWNNFENDIASYLGNKSAKNEDDLAKYITDKYDQTVRFGLNQYGEGILSTSKDILKTFIYLGLTEAKNGKDLTNTSKRFSSGILLYWSNVKMKIDVPPPSAISVVSNKITLPGIPFTFSIYNTTDSKVLAKTITNVFKLHANTIQGTTIGLVPTGTTTIPVTFNWIGVK